MKPGSQSTKPSKQSIVRARPIAAGPTASAAEARAKITAARAAAFDILNLIAANKGHSDELLHSPRTAELTPEDRNLTTALVMGVLRWQIALDARISNLLARPDQRLAEPVWQALRLGAFQLLHMDRIPAHAVLNESVELCRAAGQPHAAGMVNAILRKLAVAQKPGTRIFESVAAFAQRLGHPLWLVERWVSAYGRDAALAICEYDQREPHSGALFPLESAGESATAAHTTNAGPQMDDGSRLVAELAATALPSTAATPRVWDACAAPGGKTLILALRLPYADILATDVSPKRLANTKARLHRYAYAEHVRSAVADATDLPGQLFDLILCDVPCSGTGTLARNPEIRHRLRPEDFVRHAARQRAILTAAAQHLAPGGRIVYSTCSLEHAENQQVVEAVSSSSNLHLIPMETLLTKLAATTILAPDIAATLGNSAISDHALRTLPGVHPCDGFYAAVLERN